MLETNETPSFSRYTISSTLGTGGMGTVYRAHHEILDRTVALKVPKEEFTRDAIFVERFMREAKALATLKHPHVVSVYDAGIEDGVPYIVMECIEGRTLSDIVRDAGVLNIEDIARWGMQMADALAYVHARGVYHRDLKSANVIINRSGAAVITDFGIARIEESSSHITRGMIGTPAYMSPEQARGQPIDARSDLYSLGIVLYECLTGEVPFADDNALALIQKVINEAPPALLRRRPDTPAWLRTIVYRLLEKKPDRRYRSGKELVKAFEPHTSASVATTETGIALWQPGPPTAGPAPHREAARHFTLAVANLARALQMGGTRVRMTVHDGMTRTWYAFQHRTEIQPDPPLATVEEARPLPLFYRSVALSLVAFFTFSLLWGIVDSRTGAVPGAEPPTVESWGIYVTPGPVAPRPEVAYTPIPPADSPGVAPAPADSAVAASARRRRSPATDTSTRALAIAEARPLKIGPLDAVALNAPPPRLDTRAAAGHITVLPATIWALKEQTSSRAFVRKLRSFLRTREVAILDPGDVEAPDAAYIFLVDEARDIVPHLLTGRDTHWTDLNTGIGFEYSDEGFRYETEAGGFEAIGLQAYWVEPVQNGVTQNRRRLGW